MSDLLGLGQERSGTGEYDDVVAAGPDPQWVARTKRGANWFYWIAGLSVVNSAAYLAGGQFHFLGGLGITEVVDATIDVLVQEGTASGSMRAFAVIFDLVAVIGFALAGYYANRFIRTAFLIGIIIYAIDTAIVLLLGAYFMAAFHAFALYQLISGYLACRHLKAHFKAEALAEANALPPPPPATA